MSTQSTITGNSVRTIALAIGFFAVSGSALVARNDPATGYELSLYTMTSPLVWAGLIVAMTVALAVAFVPSPGNRGSGSLALVLGGLAMVVFVGLPIIRDYRFYGRHDALTHLGWARAISEGTITPFDMFYPGIHTVTVLINSVIEIPLSQSMLIVVLLAVLVFCVFVPLCVGTITENDRAIVIATFAGFLLLPITTLSMYLQAHAMTQSVLFSALLFYLFAKYLRADRTLASASAIGVLLLFAASAAVVYHPQLIAHLIAVFFCISAVQFLSRRFWSGSRISEQTPMYGFTLFLIVLFLVWTANHGFFSGMFEYFFNSVVEYVFARGSGGEATVAARGSSLSSVGGSLIEIILKLFFVHLVFGLLGGCFALGVLLSRDSDELSAIRPETTYFLAALVGLVPVFAVYFASSDSTLYFRVVGLMMVFVTFLGSIAIYRIADRSSGLSESIRTRSFGRLVLAAGFAALLVLSLATVFPSPYIYHASPHVSEMQMDGYGTAFDTKAEDVQFAGLASGPNRFDDAVNGNAEKMGAHADAPESSLSGLADEYDSDRYFVLTQTDYEREALLYSGLRYTAADFEAVESQQRVERIQSNGEFDMYYVNTDSSDE